MAFVEDLSVLFADFGVAAVHGSDTANALLDKETQAAFDGMVLDAEESITLATTGLPSLAAGSSITVGGVAYTVREIRLIDDGKLKRATLKRA
jgi:hypothetical protein